MRKRQKLILLFYAYAVLFLGFMYVPYVRYYPNGAKRFIGHHFRFKFLEMMPWETRDWGHTAIDANLIIAELLSITIIAVVAFLLFKRD
jgi:hypothetical protein